MRERDEDKSLNRSVWKNRFTEMIRATCSIALWLWGTALPLTKVNSLARLVRLRLHIVIHANAEAFCTQWMCGVVSCLTIGIVKSFVSGFGRSWDACSPVCHDSHSGGGVCDGRVVYSISGGHAAAGRRISPIQPFITRVNSREYRGVCCLNSGIDCYWYFQIFQGH